MRSGRSGTRALKPTALVQQGCPAGPLGMNCSVSDHGTEHPLMVQNTHYRLNRGAGSDGVLRQVQSLVGRRSLGCREKSGQFLVIRCSYREGQCVLNWRFIRASPRTTFHQASWILGGCPWILGDAQYLRPYIVKMTNLDWFGKTKTSKPLFDHQCFKASTKLNKVM